MSERERANWRYTATGLFYFLVLLFPQVANKYSVWWSEDELFTSGTFLPNNKQMQDTLLIKSFLSYPSLPKIFKQMIIDVSHTELPPADFFI